MKKILIQFFAPLFFCSIIIFNKTFAKDELESTKGNKKSIFSHKVIMKKDLLVEQDASIENLLTANDVSITGDANINNLEISNEATFNNNVLVEGSLTVTGTFSITDTLDVPSLKSDCNVSAGCNLKLPDSIDLFHGNIIKDCQPFLHNFGAGNTFLGKNAGNFFLTGMSNTGIGTSVLIANTSGQSNTAIGYFTLSNNTCGFANIGIGTQCLYSNTSGASNIAIGPNALYSNSHQENNIAIGSGSLQSSTAGDNTAIGASSLLFNTTGQYNVAVGSNVGYNNTTGSSNVFVGFLAGANNTTGSSNVLLGYESGINYDTGNNNICILHSGFSGESNAIRMGTQGVQSQTFISGIFGSIIPGGTAVIIDSNGKLGTTPSSQKFKRNIQELGSVCERLLQLRPVSFYFIDDQSSTLQYGFIAEEVAAIFPELVIYDEDGNPCLIKYHLMYALLLKAAQEAYATIQDLLKRISYLETIVLEKQNNLV